MRNEELLELYFNWIEILISKELVAEANLILTAIVNILQKLAIPCSSPLMLDKEQVKITTKQLKLIAQSCINEQSKNNTYGINQLLLSILDYNNILNTNSTHKISFTENFQSITALLYLLDDIIKIINSITIEIIADVPNSILSEALTLSICSISRGHESIPIYNNLIDINFRLLERISNISCTLPHYRPLKNGLAFHLAAFFGNVLSNDTQNSELLEPVMKLTIQLEKSIREKFMYAFSRTLNKMCRAGQTPTNRPTRKPLTNLHPYSRNNHSEKSDEHEESRNLRRR